MLAAAAGPGGGLNARSVRSGQLVGQGGEVVELDRMRELCHERNTGLALARAAAGRLRRAGSHRSRPLRAPLVMAGPGQELATWC